MVLEREPVTGRRREEDLACGIAWKASRASDIEIEIERDESENNEGKNFPGKGNKVHKGLRKREHGESRSLKEVRWLWRENSGAHNGGGQAGDLGRGRVGRTKKAWSSSALLL